MHIYFARIFECQLICKYLGFCQPGDHETLKFYPEETNGPISKVWQATHWKEFKPLECTPMYVYGLRQFYIEEVCRLTGRQLVMPLAWIKHNGELCADCLPI
jgi:hypothetical protein